MVRLPGFLKRFFRFRPLDTADGMTAAESGNFDRDRDIGGLPPAGWVKDYDEGRPHT